VGDDLIGVCVIGEVMSMIEEKCVDGWMDGGVWRRCGGVWRRCGGERVRHVGQVGHNVGDDLMCHRGRNERRNVWRRKGLFTGLKS
jgi:hypothetical protein